MKKKKTHVLAADIFDALELSVLATGGIEDGCIRSWRKATDGEKAIPGCLLGHAVAIINGDVDVATPKAIAQLSNTEVGDALEETYGSFNNAYATNDYCDFGADGLLTWEQWCEQTNTVRSN